MSSPRRRARVLLLVATAVGMACGGASDSGTGTGPPSSLNPVPVIDAITPTTGPAYGPDTTLVLTGASFMPSTEVKWGGSMLAVTYVNEHRVTAAVPASLLTVPGPVTITAINQPPGGGEGTFSYSVTLPPPVLSSIEPAVFPVGGGDVTLHLHGSFFAPDAFVLWNGARRQAYWRGGQDLVMDVPAADVQSAQTIRIAVKTGPPGGGSSAELPFVISGTAAKKLGEVTTQFDAATIVADPVRPLVYAGAGIDESGHGPTGHPHSVVAIDPAAGTIVWAISLPKEVGSLAISDDGQFLYVGESSAPTIVRIALATHAIDMTITLPGATTQPRALAVSPGHPHTFAVVRACSNCSPVIGSMAIYDDDVPRSVVVPQGPSVLAFLDPSELYGIDYLSEAYTYPVAVSGVTDATHVFTAVAGPFSLAAGRIYAAHGAVYDVTTHASKTFPMPGRVVAVVPSSDGSRLYGVDADSGALRAIDLTTGTELGAVPVNVGANGSGAAVRFGPDGIVFAGDGAVVYARADFIR